MQMSCVWIESAQVGGDLELLSIEKWRLEKFDDFFFLPDALSIDFACVCRIILAYLVKRAALTSGRKSSR